MHTVRVKLKTTAYQESIIDRRFHALSHIHNVLVKHVRKRLVQMEHDSEYILLLEEIRQMAKKERLSAAEKHRRKEVRDRLKQIRKDYGLTEYALQSYIKVCGKQYRKLVSSSQVQKEATRIWRSVEKYLFSNGKQIHFKKYRDFRTIGGKSNTNGAKFQKETMSVSWLGLSLSCVVPRREKDRLYLEEALSHDVRYCEIERLMFPNGWHYYAVIYLSGDAPRKQKHIGTGTMGIDPGVSSIAAASDTLLVLQELAPDVSEYNRRIIKLQKYMDASRRATNPRKFHSDGTINRANHDPWILSKGYKKAMDRLKSVYRQKTSYTKQSHEILCNHLLSDSKTFVVEKMVYHALQRRAKKTERSDTLSVVKDNKGRERKVRKYKKKKRFGRTLNNRSPSLFLQILQRKCQIYGCVYTEIDTQAFKASQYDHVKDTYQKIPLKQRFKEIGGQQVQRDLYSAFLIRNTDDNLKAPNRELCSQKFNDFVVMQNQLIGQMKHDGVSMRQCFGF